MDSQPSQPSQPPVRRRDMRSRAEEASRRQADEVAGPAETTATRRALAARRRRRRLLGLLLALTVVIATLDQVTKILAMDRLTEGSFVPFLGDVIGFQLVRNPGAAFSIATGMTWVFTIVMVVVAIAVLRFSRRLGSTTWAAALGMLLGGCIGNLIDRLFRDPGFARGHVVDFINYNGWFVGNVADIAIVGAAVLIALLALLGREIDGSQAGDEAEREQWGHEPERGEPDRDVTDRGESDRDEHVAAGRGDGDVHADDAHGDDDPESDPTTPTAHA